MNTSQIVKLVQQGKLSAGSAAAMIAARRDGAAHALRDGALLPLVFGAGDLHLAGHSVAGRALLFGMMYCALFATLARDGGDAIVRLRDLAFVKPLAQDDGATLLNVALLAGVQGEPGWRCEARNARAELLVHASCEQAPALALPAPLRGLPQGAWQSGQLAYEQIARSGIDHRADLESLRRWMVQGDEVWFELGLEPRALEADAAFALSPTLLNAGYLAACLLLPVAAGAPLVPLSLREMTVFGALQGAAMGRARVLRRRSDGLDVDIDFYDLQGAPLAALAGLSIMRVSAPAAFVGAGAPAAAPQPAPVAPAAPVAHADADAGLASGIAHFVAAKIGSLIGQAPANIAPDTSLMQLGVDSAALLMLAREFEQQLQIELYPTVFFEYQTVSAITAYFLADHRAAFAALVASAPAPAVPVAPVAPEVPVVSEVPVVPAAPARTAGRDIAVIGIGGRFAQASGWQEFWQELSSGRNLVREIPPSRWELEHWFHPVQGDGASYCKWGSFIDDVGRFDAEFFSMSPREAAAMDPQLRILLQVVHETAEDAGYAGTLAGSNTGMYVGACFREYWDEMLRAKRGVGPYDLTGNASAFLSNRPSYHFDLHGPSLTVDDACSSALVALHLACKALQSGECERAFVAGANLLLSPLHYQHFSAIEALSGSGQCHSFDASADGYVPGEAVCAVLLKPLDQALADGDNIHAVIKGSALNHAGRSNSPTAPSVNQQADLLAKAWTDAGIAPETLSYIEAHGTGTRLGDPIEIRAINKAFARFTTRQDFCAIGSAKAHLGHTEGAAGLVGVIKTILSMKHAVLPAMPNFASLNPYIDLAASPLYVARENRAWLETSGVPLRAGVSSFGLGGGYAHAVLEAAPRRAQPARAHAPQAVLLSAHSEQQLVQQTARLAQFLRQAQADGTPPELADIAFTLQSGRRALAWRYAWVGADLGYLIDSLAAFTGLAGEPQRARHAPGAQGGAQAAIGGQPLEQLAQRWLAGETVDWAALHAQPRRISLPTYPFGGEVHWFDGAGSAVAAVPPAPAAPAAPVAVSSALIDGWRADGDGIHGSKRLSVVDACVSAHRIHGTPVLPGVAHLGMIADLCVLAGRGRPTAIRDYYWLRPVLAGAAPLELTLALGAARDGAASVALRAAGAGGADYSSGLLDWAAQDAPAALALDALRARCREVDVGAVYDEITSHGLQLGDAYRSLRRLHGNADEALGYLELDPQGQAFDGAGCLNPGLMDSINHCARGITVEPALRLALAVPFHLQQMRWYAPLPRACYVHVRPGHGPGSYHFLVTDVHGAPVLAIDNLSYRAFATAAPVQPVAAAPVAAAMPPPRAGHADVQGVLVALLADVLALPATHISGERNVADYGADSVAIAQFMRKVNQHFALSLTPARFFEHNTVASFASFLVQSEGVAAGPPPAAAPAPAPVAPAPAPAPAARSGDIAVIGMHGRFPGSEDLDGFWKSLFSKDDMIGEIPKERFDWTEVFGDSQQGEFTHSKWGGFLNDIDAFDADLFGISRREAELMDPQQRLFLQSSWSALEHAGYAPRGMARKDVGVFAGVVMNEYYELLNDRQVGIAAHTATGMARSILPNRISYLLDLTGPSEPVDTACSSSLVAVHRAIQSLRDGECSMAIAGGVNLILKPNLFISFSKAGMLSPSGKCQVFDHKADGYVRGEGCAAVVLKPLQQALADGDRIYGVIRHSAVNHGGRANSMTTPNPQSQAALLEKVYRAAGVAADSITYIEAHGTGTPLGDPVEINALKMVFGRGAEKRCGIGSVKANIGHLEGAAGIAGMVKVLLAMEHGMLPPAANFSQLNPYIELDDTPLYIVEQATSWERLRDAEGRQIPRRAGVSSFGFGGVNAHLLLEEHLDAGVVAASVAPGAPQVMPLAARNPEQRDAYLRQMADYLRRHLADGTHAGAAARQRHFDSLIRTMQCGRDPMAERVAIVASDAPQLLAEIELLLAGQGSAATFSGRAEIEGAPLSAPLDNALLAQQWTRGAVVDWRALWRGRDVGTVALPTYPFARQRYWIPEPAPVAGAKVRPPVVPVMAAVVAPVAPPPASAAAPHHPLFDAAFV